MSEGTWLTGTEEPDFGVIESRPTKRFFGRLTFLIDDFTVAILQPKDREVKGFKHLQKFRAAFPRLLQLGHVADVNLQLPLASPHTR